MAKILVTDDSNFLRRITCSILNGAGHHIIEAENGVECMKLIEQEQPDVVFLDLIMPEMDGLSVLASLKALANPVPVIVLTADIQRSTKNECLQLGAAGFLNKPPKEDEVLQALQFILKAKGIS